MFEVLKFFTCGSVDDGKSTLIGRLMYDSGAISSDIVEVLSKRGNRPPNAEIDLALITDGLKAEREQGITIDVAYKYFSTKKRKFILVDTPGHFQYTRNMITGASGCDLGIIIVDARNGMVEQTKRHIVISSILEVPHLVFCVNKMDLVEYSEEVFNQISSEILEFFKKVDKHNITIIPISAYLGDNVVRRSEKMDWYKGPTVMELLENIEVEYEDFNKSRFQVQYTIRPGVVEFHDYRGYAGRVISGKYEVGDKVRILPGDYITEITKIESNLKDVKKVEVPYNCIIHLKDDLDISRGTYIVKDGEEPIVSDEFNAYIFWMNERKKLFEGDKLILMHGSFTTKCVVKEIIKKVDVNSFEEVESNGEIGVNEIGKIYIKTAYPICYDYYSEYRWTGCFILIDENTNNTVAGGIING